MAATTRVHGFGLVTRDITGAALCDVDLIDPFQSDPKVIRVRA